MTVQAWIDNNKMLTFTFLSIDVMVDSKISNFKRDHAVKCICINKNSPEGREWGVRMVVHGKQNILPNIMVCSHAGSNAGKWEFFHSSWSSFSGLKIWRRKNNILKVKCWIISSGQSPEKSIILLKWDLVFS